MRVIRGRPDPVVNRMPANRAGVVCDFTWRLRASAEANCYAAIIAAAAASVLELIMPLRPVGKKPPCLAPALPPKAR